MSYLNTFDGTGYGVPGPVKSQFDAIESAFQSLEDSYASAMRFSAPVTPLPLAPLRANRYVLYSAGDVSVASLSGLGQGKYSSSRAHFEGSKTISSDGQKFSFSNFDVPLWMFFSPDTGGSRTELGFVPGDYVGYLTGTVEATTFPSVEVDIILEEWDGTSWITADTCKVVAYNESEVSFVHPFRLSPSAATKYQWSFPHDGVNYFVKLGMMVFKA